MLWQTCLRKIAFGASDSMGEIKIEAGDQILAGEDAYRFCLEVICGLHSPLVGETEVFGQFKNAADSWVIPAGPFGLEMRRFIRSIIEDAKKIRSAHLSDLGSQSYGSLLRRELRGVGELTIVGAGHLTGEILPWISKDGIKVKVAVRNLPKTMELQAKFPNAKFVQLGSEAGNLSGALILSAPVTAAWTKSWLGDRADQIKLVADLRGESTVDPLKLDKARVLGLNEIMSRISSNQKIIARRRDDALEAIEKAVEVRGRSIENRPFGWDDVCA